MKLKIFLGSVAAVGLLLVFRWLALSNFVQLTKQYDGPAREYVLGRYAFSVPDELKEDGILLEVFPPVHQGMLNTYETDRFTIREIPWKGGNRQQEFEDAWRPLREEVLEHDNNKATAYLKDGREPELTYKENLDASNFFGGYPAIIIGHRLDSPPAFVETFIALPQGVLHLEEYRHYYKTEKGEDLETPAMAIFKHYSWGKSRNGKPGAFYTEYGKVDGYAVRNEQAGAHFMDFDENREYDLVYSTRVPSPIPPALKKAIKNTSMPSLPFGYSITNLVERVIETDGEQFKEYINVNITPRRKYLVFRLQSPEYKGTVEHPHVDIEFRAPWAEREKAMLMWNFIRSSFKPASCAQNEAQ